jgi:hypothetical protein
MKGGRECSESTLDYLLLELVHHYRTQEYGPPLQAAIEAIGLRVGRQLIERYTKDKPPLVDQLEVMKFICKDFWSEVFRKNVDNLRTNKRCAGGIQSLFLVGSSLYFSSCCWGGAEWLRAMLGRVSCGGSFRQVGYRRGSKGGCYRCRHGDKAPAC